MSDDKKMWNLKRAVAMAKSKAKKDKNTEMKTILNDDKVMEKFAEILKFLEGADNLGDPMYESKFPSAEEFFETEFVLGEIRDTVVDFKAGFNTRDIFVLIERISGNLEGAPPYQKSMLHIMRWVVTPSILFIAFMAFSIVVE